MIPTPVALTVLLGGALVAQLVVARMVSGVPPWWNRLVFAAVAVIGDLLARLGEDLARYHDLHDRIDRLSHGDRR